MSDPLVEDVRVVPDRVRIDLARGAEAESYTLERPFRIVFDVVIREEPEDVAEEIEDVEPPRDRPGLNMIVIDPGHGGVETGAVGADGVLEKDLTLTLARLLRDRLRQELPVRVVLTRDDDVTLAHDARPAVANQNKADLFISIHLNSSLGSTAHGAETYFLSNEASDARAAAAAEAENRSARAGADSSDEDPLYDLQLILWDLAQSHHLSESQRVATLIQRELNSTLGLRDRGVKQAPFRVLMGAAMPAVLVELGFLSNPSEAAKLDDPAYRSELVAALVRAVGQYRAQLEGTPDEPADGRRRGRGAHSVSRLRGFPAVLVAGLLVTLGALGLAGCGGDGDGSGGGDGAAEGSQAARFDLYFPGEGGLLHAEERELEVTAEPRDRARAIVLALLEGPRGRNVYRPFPEDVGLIEIYFDPDGTITVDLGAEERELPPPSGSMEEMTRVYSVVDSLVYNVPEARRVMLLWNGVQRESFAGHLDTSVPLEPSVSILSSSAQARRREAPARDSQ